MEMEEKRQRLTERHWWVGAGQEGMNSGEEGTRPNGVIGSPYKPGQD